MSFVLGVMTGDDDRSPDIATIYEFHQIKLLCTTNRIQAPIIREEYINALAVSTHGDRGDLRARVEAFPVGDASVQRPLIRLWAFQSALSR